MDDALAEIAAGIEAATGRNRFVDEKLTLLFRAANPDDPFFDDFNAYSGSIDNSVTLIEHVLPGWVWLKKSEFVATLVEPLTAQQEANKAWPNQYSGKGATFALSLLAALVTVLKDGP